MPLPYLDSPSATRLCSEALGLRLVDNQGWAKVESVSQAAFVGVIVTRERTLDASREWTFTSRSSTSPLDSNV